MKGNKKLTKGSLRIRKSRKEREEVLKERMGLKFLNQKELKLLKDAFEKLDSDKSGEIDKEELVKTLTSYGCTFDSGKVMKFFNDSDKNGTKRIDFDEFLDGISSELQLSEDALRQVFALFIGNDQEDSLTIEHLKKLGSVYNEEQLQELIDATDSTHSGKVSFEDFYKMIMTKV